MKGFMKKIGFLFASSLVAAQNIFAQTLDIPAGTDTKLIGYINDAFGVIIGVVIVLIAASIILKMLRKAGG